jgi:hypothetical protein
VKFNADNFIKIDTLKGKIGRSDFAIDMRLYTGKDTTRMKKENFLQFTSRFLDVDEMSSYDFAPSKGKKSAAREDSLAAIAASNPTQPTVHAEAFNIFKIPFIDFRGHHQNRQDKVSEAMVEKCVHECKDASRPFPIP